MEKLVFFDGLGNKIVFRVTPRGTLAIRKSFDNKIIEGITLQSEDAGKLKTFLRGRKFKTPKKDLDN